HSRSRRARGELPPCHDARDPDARPGVRQGRRPRPRTRGPETADPGSLRDHGTATGRHPLGARPRPGPLSRGPSRPMARARQSSPSRPPRAAPSALRGPKEPRMTPEQVRARVQADKVDYILAQFVDIHGTPRCKGVPARALDLFLEGSAGFAGAAVSGMGQGPHDHDMIAIPDLASYTPVPWETGVARFACDITVDGQAWPYCSRTALRRMTAELLGQGYVMMVGAEAEHFLVRRREDGSIAPFDPDGVDTLEKPCYDFKSLAGSMGYLRTLVTYLDQLGWEPYASDHEDGTAQYEINWKYSDALTTADRVTFYKMMTSQV